MVNHGEVARAGVVLADLEIGDCALCAFLHVGDVPSHIEVVVHILIIGGMDSAFLVTDRAFLAIGGDCHKVIVSCGIVTADVIQEVALFVWHSTHEQAISIDLHFADVFVLPWYDWPSDLVQVGLKVDGGAINLHHVVANEGLCPKTTRICNFTNVRTWGENFIKEGLTQQTHYISSTGIQGVPANPKAIIQMDAYSILDISPNQQQYLYAASHLNPTYEYGVTFERGTKVKYGDRSHIFISGTASIDNKGNVVHVGDIVQQTLRMWDNVEALLSEGNATTNDIAQIIVYLRDIADYNTVQSMFDDKFPNTPIMITQAPVCRPTWLIEMECIAITEEHNEEFRNF